VDAISPPTLVVREVEIFTGESVIPTSYIYLRYGIIADFGHGDPKSHSGDVTPVSKAAHTAL
jgi:hypothetical protein